MPKAAGVKPRLNSLDELFGLESDSKLSPDAEYALIPFDMMDSFPGHPFRTYTGQRKDDMVESIREKGILQPLIIRAMENGRYQILSGHNRKECAVEAGLAGGPAVIKRNLSDDEALIYVIETNLMQRSFSDMAHSEKAAVLALHHSKLFSQGKRNDIISELQMLEKHHAADESQTSVEISQRSGAREALAKEYGLAPFCIAQYLRVFKLTDELKRRLDNREIALTPAVALSFLNENEQLLLSRCIELNGFKVDTKKAAVLREYSDKGRLDDESVYLILNGEAGKSPKDFKTPSIKVGKDIYAKYFRPNQSAKEVRGIVEKALELYFSSQQQ